MAAVIGLSDDSDVHAACARSEGEAWVANYNAPDQTVIAGSHAAVNAAAETALELGARDVKQLSVGGAFHTPFMDEARLPLRRVLSEATFRPPRIPTVANVDARAHESARDWSHLLSAQLCSPVR